MSSLAIILGLAIGNVILAQYRLWKQRRPVIPMEEQNGVWVADGKLRRWERNARWAWWMLALCCITMTVTMLTI